MEEEDEFEEQEPITEEKELGNENRMEIPHKTYLETCYTRQIGLPIEEPQRIDIFSFTNKRIAKGYQQIKTTCQGMYYEMRSEQVDWKQWNNRRATVVGDWCWR